MGVFSEKSCNARLVANVNMSGVESAVTVVAFAFKFQYLPERDNF